MKTFFSLILVGLLIISCQKKQTENKSLAIEGTWKLVSATLIEKGDTNVTDYTQNISFIKIINKTHFAFLSHNIPSKTDTVSKYSSGGGKYSLVNNTYTEHLEYCTDRPWEGNDFKFTLEIKGDTLIQSGIEKIEKEGINRLNIEKYVKLN